MDKQRAMRVPKKIVFLKAKFFSKTWLGKFTGDHCVDVSVAETTINKCEKQQKSKSLISSDCLRSIFKFLHLEKGTRASRWLRGKEYACQCRRHGFDYWSRKIPHAADQLSLRSTASAPGRHSHWSPHAREPVLRKKRSHHREQPANRD